MMKMKKGVLVFLSAMLIVLELLPYGAVIVYPDASEAGAYTETHSYFSLQPFSHANYFPLAIAVLSCVLLCLVLIYTYKNRTLGAIKTISIIIVLLSFSPVVLGVSYFSAVGIAIAGFAFAETVWVFAIGQTAQ